MGDGPIRREAGGRFISFVCRQHTRLWKALLEYPCAYLESMIGTDCLATGEMCLLAAELGVTECEATRVKAT